LIDTIYLATAKAVAESIVQVMTSNFSTIEALFMLDACMSLASGRVIIPEPRTSCSFPFQPVQGRIITGEELCTSLDRMYNAFAGKLYEPTGSAKLPPGYVPSKTLSPGEIDDMISR
jgi:hypothetical protein